MFNILILAVVFFAVAVISSNMTRKSETKKTLDAVVEDTRERFKRGEFDD